MKQVLLILQLIKLLPIDVLLKALEAAASLFDEASNKKDE